MFLKNLDKIWIKGHGQHFCKLQFDEIFLLYITNLFFISERPPQRRHMFISFRPPKVEKYVAILFFILRGICSHTFFIFHSCMHELLAYQLHSCLAIHFRFSLFKYCDMICLKGIPKIKAVQPILTLNKSCYLLIQRSRDRCPS